MSKGNNRKAQSSKGTTVEIPASIHDEVLSLFERIRQAGFTPPPLRQFVSQALGNEIPREEKKYVARPRAS